MFARGSKDDQEKWLQSRLTGFAAHWFVVYISSETISDWSIDSDESAQVGLERDMFDLCLKGGTC